MSSLPAPNSAAAPPAASAAGSPPGATPSKASTKKSPSKAVAKAGATNSKAVKPKKPKPPRKKKPPAATAASSQTVIAEGRAAAADLAKQRAEAAALRADPLWYKIEDVLPPAKEAATSMAVSTCILPEQVHVVENALTACGLTRSDVTPQAMACLLEQARRFAYEIITHAEDYAFAAGRTELAKADLMLAYDMRAEPPTAITTQLPKLNLVAQKINRRPLPPIPPQCYNGVLLPSKEYQLTARTFDIISGAQVAQKMVQKPPQVPRAKGGTSTSAATTNASSSYGAARGRQISVNLKKKEGSMDASDNANAPAAVAAATSGALGGAASTTGQPQQSSSTSAHGASASSQPLSAPSGGLPMNRPP